MSAGAIRRGPRITARASFYAGAVVVTCWHCDYRLLTTPRDVVRVRRSHICEPEA